jgi:hypothetical protein
MTSCNFDEQLSKGNKSSFTNTPNEKDPKIFPLVELFSSTFVTRPMEIQYLQSKHICNNLTFVRRKENLN